MNGLKGGEPGFTLIETLFAMLIASVLLGSMYLLSNSLLRSFSVQEQVADAQQSARAAIQLMSRDIIMAGYSSATGVIFANRTSLTIQNRGTSISYFRDSNSRIGRREGASARTVTEHVTKLSFNYKDGSGSDMIPDGSGNVESGYVRQITFSVTTETPALGGHSEECTVEASIQPRNLKLW